MKRTNFCGSPEHALDRRRFLGTLTAGAGALALGGLQAPGVARELKQQQKRVILLWLAGGASQLETFDPKPGAVTGGPFRAIKTAVPGIAISELTSRRFSKGRQSGTLASHNEAYQRVRGLMASDKLFDVTKESEKMRDK